MLLSMLCCDVLIIYADQLGSILKKYLFLIYTLLFYKAVEKPAIKSLQIKIVKNRCPNLYSRVEQQELRMEYLLDLNIKFVHASQQNSFNSSQYQITWSISVPQKREICTSCIYIKCINKIDVSSYSFIQQIFTVYLLCVHC